ncbi:MAG: quinolinate synthase NadA, partial [Bacillota bacterium]
KEIENMRLEHPQAKVLVHPEAPLKVLLEADFVGSTKNILDYATKSSAKEFIIGTDKGLIHALEKQNPDKSFYLLSRGLNCLNMKRITIEDVYESLNAEKFEIDVEPDIQKKAIIALDRMMELS